MLNNNFGACYQFECNNNTNNVYKPQHLKCRNNDNKWIQCAKSPIASKTNFLEMNKNRFITMGDGGRCHEYNGKSDEWRIFSIPSINKQINSVTLDEINKEIYAFTVDITGKIHKFELENDEYRMIETKRYFNKNHKALSICINGEYHLISTRYTKNDDYDDIHNNILAKSYHFVFDKNRNKLTEIYKFNNNHSNSGIIYVSSRNILLLIGGNYDDKIWCYYLTKKKWKMWRIRNLLSTQLIAARDFGYVLTENQRFILFFGGIQDLTKIRSRHIYIMDIKKKEIKRSVINCPLYGGFKTILMKQNNYYIATTIIQSLYRNSRNLQNLQNVYYLIPNDVINVIVNFYSNKTFIHLFVNDDTMHYKIKTESILQSKK